MKSSPQPPYGVAPDIPPSDPSDHHTLPTSSALLMVGIGVIIVGILIVGTLWYLRLAHSPPDVTPDSVPVATTTTATTTQPGLSVEKQKEMLQTMDTYTQSEDTIQQSPDDVRTLLNQMSDATPPGNLILKREDQINMLDSMDQQ